MADDISRLARFARGIRVLDVSAFLPGPLAALLLADMGADVVKIEPPAGDPLRELGPRDAKGRAVFHDAVNAGKSVRRIDLKRPEGRAAFLALAEAADVLIEGFRPGAMQRLGLDYAALKPRNPRLVYCSLSGYGAAGPLATAAGHDANYLATAGVLHRNAGFFDPPLADVSGALFGVIAILGALRARDADGQGCAIDLALADAVMPLQLLAIAAHGATGEVPQPRATYLNGGAAYYQIYPTRDGRHIALGAIEHKFWRAFCVAAGRPDWIARQQEALPQHALMADVAALVATLTLRDCLARFADSECCVSAVLDLGEALASPHHRTRGVVGPAPDGAMQARFPALIDGIPPAPRPILTEGTESACPN